ncbi:hypothetical protein [Actinomadura terrae]|uniref:hypothetical protein n=1 Tax=Actinomadura terrae TaxID=604353 RepID=UPI001FA78445|nr:hypothetical protein [Actinomadura terrae]
MTINQRLQGKIVRRLFQEAEEIDWIYLPDQRRTETYNQWVQNPEIGGRLTEFMPAAQARVWIKDGPMKEFARARFGVGTYAQYVSNPTAGANQLVRSALGEDWEADIETRNIKPLRLRVYKGEEEVMFTWAPFKDFKHLVWAAIKAKAEGNEMPWVLCALGSFENPIPEDMKAFHRRVAQQCQVRVVHVEGV